ncbi:MAG: hypothetical protein WBP60_04610 [Gammaproteobacteria bacterium]
MTEIRAHRFRRSIAQLSTLVFSSVSLCGLPMLASAAESGGNWLDNWWQQPWSGDARVYGWLVDAPAGIRVNGQPAADLPESLDTVLDSANALFMGEFAFQKGRIGLFADVIYYDGTDKTSRTGPLGEQRKVEVKERVWLVEYGAGFELVNWNLGERDNSPTLTLSPYAGFRYFHDPIRVTVPPGPVFPGVNVKRTVEINTPLVGAKALLTLSDRWTLAAGGDYGVWDDGEVDETWQYIGTLNYHFAIKGVSTEVFVGYRKLKLDLENDAGEDLEIDVELKGPVIGFGVGW